jgi:hypothetical protein
MTAKKYFITSLTVFFCITSLYSKPYTRYVSIEFYYDTAYTKIDSSEHTVQMYAKDKSKPGKEVLKNIFRFKDEDYSDTLLLKIDRHTFQLTFREIAHAAILKVYLNPLNTSNEVAIFPDSLPLAIPEKTKNAHRITMIVYTRDNGYLNTPNAQLNKRANSFDIIEFLEPMPFRPKITEPDIYNVNEIKSDGDYYVIYVSNEKRRFKIVTRKSTENTCDKEIEVNKDYVLKLRYAIYSQSCLVNCTFFDKQKKFCEDDDAGLFLTSDLKGLCYVRNN